MRSRRRKRLAEFIGNMPGVVEHGLFIGLVNELLVAGDGEVRIVKNDR